MQFGATRWRGDHCISAGSSSAPPISIWACANINDGNADERFYLCQFSIGGAPPHWARRPNRQPCVDGLEYQPTPQCAAAGSNLTAVRRQPLATLVVEASLRRQEAVPAPCSAAVPDRLGSYHISYWAACVSLASDCDASGSEHDANVGATLGDIPILPRSWCALWPLFQTGHRLDA